MIIVKRGSAGDDHFPEAVEIEEHTPLRCQLYSTQHTHKLWCDVYNAGQYMCRLPYGTQDFLQQSDYSTLMSWTMKYSGSLLAICCCH